MSYTNWQLVKYYVPCLDDCSIRIKYFLTHCHHRNWSSVESVTASFGAPEKDVSFEIAASIILSATDMWDNIIFRRHILAFWRLSQPVWSLAVSWLGENSHCDWSMVEVGDQNTKDQLFPRTVVDAINRNREDKSFRLSKTKRSLVSACRRRLWTDQLHRLLLTSTCPVSSETMSRSAKPLLCVRYTNHDKRDGLFCVLAV